MGDRAHVVAAQPFLGRTLARRLVEGEDEPLAAAFRGHHGRLGTGDELARVRRVIGPDGNARRDGQRPRRLGLEPSELLRQALREAERAREVARRQDDRELLAADPADDVVSANRVAQHVRDLQEELVSDAVPVDVVDPLEVVEVDHHERDRVVLHRGPHHLLAQPVVEGAVVVEAREGVGRGLVLEASPDVRIVDRERGGVSEAASEQELLLAELDVLADAIDVQRPLQPSAGDQRNGDQCLRVDGRAGDEPHAGVEVRLVGEDGLAMLDRPAGDAFAEREGLAHDLVFPLAPRQNRYELPLGLVRLVDVHVLVRDQLGERVGDALEQRVEALLGEDVVEDLRQAPVRLRRRCSRGRSSLTRGDKAHLRSCRRLDGHRVRHGGRSGGVIGRVAGVLERSSAKIRARGRRTAGTARPPHRPRAALSARVVAADGRARRGRSRA